MESVKRVNVQGMLEEILKDDKIKKEFNMIPGEKEATFTVSVDKDDLLGFLIKNYN